MITYADLGEYHAARSSGDEPKRRRAADRLLRYVEEADHRSVMCLIDAEADLADQCDAARSQLAGEALRDRLRRLHQLQHECIVRMHAYERLPTQAA